MKSDVPPAITSIVACLRFRCMLGCLVLALTAGAVMTSCDNRKPGPVQSGRAAPPVTATASAEPTEATTAQTITFRLIVAYRRDARVRIPEIGTRIAGLRIVDFGEDGPADVDGGMQHTKWFSLRADIAGSYIIPEMTVSWSMPDNDTWHDIRTPQIFIKVTPPAAAAAGSGQADIGDIKPPLEPPRSLRPWILGAAAAAVLAAGGAAAVLLRLRRRARQTAVRKSAHEIAFEELERLDREQLLARGGVREYYFRLSDIFRHYLEDRFSLPAVEQTTQELLPKIMALTDMNARTKSSVREVLTHADLVKFARHLPSDDAVASSREQVRSVIDETKIVETADAQPAGAAHNAANTPHAGAGGA